MLACRCTSRLHAAATAPPVRRAFLSSSPALAAAAEDDPSPAAAEAVLREELAAAHLLMVRYNMDDLVWNHVSARLPWSPDEFLVTPGRMLFDEIRPDDLVVASDNVTANVIHSAFYEARPDVMAVVHTHSRSTMGVSCLAEGLRYLTQDAAAFYGRTGYHDWQGVSDCEDEKTLLGADLGPAPNHTLIMRNHGVATVGASVGEAWVRGYFLDRVCQVQMDTLGEPLHEPDEDVLAKAAAQFDGEFQHGEHEWEAMMRWYRRETGRRG